MRFLADGPSIPVELLEQTRSRQSRLLLRSRRIETSRPPSLLNWPSASWRRSVREGNPSFAHVHHLRPLSSLTSPSWVTLDQLAIIIRYMPMTRWLTEASREARHLRAPRVLCDGTGRPLTQKVVQMLAQRTGRRANVKPGILILRHTFCSHLAIGGAPGSHSGIGWTV
jgi:hypothetical protein